VDRVEGCLLPTQLCDFDRHSAIGEKASQLAQGCYGDRQRFDRVYQFVKELPYGLEDWDVKASETLGKGWGMCCGKTNLLVAMSRTLSIPARYRVFRIRAERRLLRRVIEQDKELAAQLGELLPEQDHLQCEVYLGDWEVYDPSRDPAFESGLKMLGIPLERVPVLGIDGKVQFTILASVDEWARRRQENRRFRKEREALFARMNEEINKIRQMGRQSQAGDTRMTEPDV
jgi:hypothetical protein